MSSARLLPPRPVVAAAPQYVAQAAAVCEMGATTQHHRPREAYWHAGGGGVPEAPETY